MIRQVRAVREFHQQRPVALRNEFVIGLDLKSGGARRGIAVRGLRAVNADGKLEVASEAQRRAERQCHYAEQQQQAAHLFCVFN